MSDEEFEIYKMFQKFQVAQIMSSSTITLAQTGNSTVCFTSIAPNT